MAQHENSGQFGPSRSRHDVIAASGMPGDALDGWGKSDSRRRPRPKLVDLAGCVGRRLDLDQRRMPWRTMPVSKGRADTVGMGCLVFKLFRCGARSINSTIVRSGNAGWPRFRTWLSALVRFYRGSDLLDKIDDAAPKLASPMRVKARVSARPSDVARKSERGRRSASVLPSASPCRSGRLRTKTIPAPGDFGDLLNAARADAVGALLVFPRLLSQAERIAELFLAHAEHDATHAHATADILQQGGRFGRDRRRSSGPRCTRNRTDYALGGDTRQTLQILLVRSFV